jgi:hypothetical protein
VLCKGILVLWIHLYCLARIIRVNLSELFAQTFEFFKYVLDINLNFGRRIQAPLSCVSPTGLALCFLYLRESCGAMVLN